MPSIPSTIPSPARKWPEVRDLFAGLNERPEVTIAAVMNTSYGCGLLIAEFTRPEKAAAESLFLRSFPT